VLSRARAPRIRFRGARAHLDSVADRAQRRTPGRYREVRRIELELEGVTTVARLLDDLAPKACQALLDALPFEDDVTHGRWSGGRLHTHRHPDLGLSADD